MSNLQTDNFNEHQMENQDEDNVWERMDNEDCQNISRAMSQADIYAKIHELNNEILTQLSVQQQQLRIRVVMMAMEDETQELINKLKDQKKEVEEQLKLIADEEEASNMGHPRDL